MNQSQDFGFPGLFSSFYLLGVQPRFTCSFNGFQEGVEANALIPGSSFSSFQGWEGNGETIETVFSSCVTYCLVLYRHLLSPQLQELPPLHCRDPHPLLPRPRRPRCSTSFTNALCGHRLLLLCSFIHSKPLNKSFEAEWQVQGCRVKCSWDLQSLGDTAEFWAHGGEIC